MNMATRCGAALSRHPAAAAAVGECAGEVLDLLDGDRPDLLVCFASPHYRGTFDEIAGGLRTLLEPDVLVGGVFEGVAGGSTETHHGPAISVLAAVFGTGTAAAVRLEARRDIGGSTITGWPDDLPARGTLLLLADTATFPVEDFLALANAKLPELDVVGGISVPTLRTTGYCAALDDRVFASGAVGVLVDPAIPVRTLVSQGCRPVGSPFTVTRSEGSRLQELAGRPALERLREVAEAIAGDPGDLMGRDLHVGIVVDEHRLDFRRGDFLVRALREVDESGGSLSVGAPIDVGTTIQFQVRDAESAGDDLRLLLGRETTHAAGALLFCGEGRDEQFFGDPDHDASAVQEIVGPLPLAGAVCAAEIGPVGGRSERHGFSASVVLIG